MTYWNSECILIIAKAEWFQRHGIVFGGGQLGGLSTADFGDSRSARGACCVDVARWSANLHFSLPEVSTMNAIPEWRLIGDWFDICSCNIPCPCEFAQAPTNNACQGMLAWHVRDGHYGQVRLDGLNLIALGGFEGNLWTDENVKARMGFFIDERADAQQREALQAIFTGQAGGWPAGFASKIGEKRGLEFVPITFEVAPD